MPGEAIKIGPFVGMLNTFSDPSATSDDELVECLNFEPDLDGSLKSRPPAIALNTLDLGPNGNMRILGTFVTPTNASYIIASDGEHTTYYYDGTSWRTLTDTISATAMVQFDNKAWLLAGVNESNPGGTWNNSRGYEEEPNMPKGDVIIAHKLRLWVAHGTKATAEGTRLFFSKVLGQTDFWMTTPDFIDIGGGDGQNIIQAVVYFQSILLFRSNSIYQFTYSTDPTNGVVSVVIPGIGLTNKDCVAASGNYLYFTYHGRAYEFNNARANQINVKVPFTSESQVNIFDPYTVSVFNERVMFQWWDTTYVYYIKTRTWTRWRSTEHGAFGRWIELPLGDNAPEALCFSARTRDNGFEDTNSIYIHTDRNDLPQGFYLANGALRVGGSYVASVYVRGTRGIQFDLAGRSEHTVLGHVEGQGTSRITLTGDWQRISTVIPFAVDAAPYTSLGFQLRQVTPAKGVSLYAAKPQLELGNILSDWTDDITLNLSGNPRFLTTAGLTGYFSAPILLEGSNQARKTQTLSMRDTFSDRIEYFDCLARTKNYNYEASTVWKRLYQWFIDGVFQGVVTGTLYSVLYREKTSWGQLRRSHWSETRKKTWGSLTSDTMTIVSVRDTGSNGAMRKVVKMGTPSLRFKQIAFSVGFVSDGSIDSSPVRFNSLMTVVRAKETVSKTVS